MMDYLESRIARREFEERVRSFTPVQDHDSRLTDDRQLSIYPILSGIVGRTHVQRGWVSKQAGRLLSVMVNGLTSLGEWIKHVQDLRKRQTQNAG